MIRIPLMIAGLLTVGAIVAASYVATSSALGLSGSELINAEIAIFACLGAAISATFVIYSYLQTNYAFVESQRPQLLLQVHSHHEPDPSSANQPILMTRVLYRNITNNMFRDLTIHIKAIAENREVELSDLFAPHMTMVGTDERNRTFNTLDELNTRGMDIQKLAQNGHDVILRAEYAYTFNRQYDEVHVNEYRWNASSATWHIV